jgi:hypothetical protein
MSLRIARPVLLVAGVVAVLLTLAGCDSAGDDDLADAGAQTTVQFGRAELSTKEEDRPTVEVPVTISNPPGGEPVTAEVLFARGSSTADFADLNLDTNDLDDEAIFGTDTTGYVADTVSFGADVEDGATRTATFPISDNRFEREETARFALQNISGAQVGRPTEATLGSPSEFSLVIESEGTETFLSADFSEGMLAPLEPVSVASSANWGTSSEGAPFEIIEAPYAIINAFGADEPANDWLITPESYDFGPFDTVTLSFANATNFNDEGLEGAEALRVKVSTDYDGEGAPTDFAWTDVSDRIENYSPGGYEFVTAQIDLSDFGGEGAPVYVAFQYMSSGTGAGSSEVWEVDNIELVGMIDVPDEN